MVPLTVIRSSATYSQPTLTPISTNSKKNFCAMALLKIKVVFDGENNLSFVSQTLFEKIILMFMQ